MPNRKPKIFRTVSYRNAKGETTDVVVTAVQPDAPTMTDVVLTPSTSGGTLAAATYTYKVSVVVNGIESAASATANAVVGGAGTGSVAVDATAMLAKFKGWSSWKLYGRTGTQLLIATTNSPTATFTDTGAVTPTGASIANDKRINFRNRFTKVTQTAVAAATGVADTDKYYAR